MLTTVLKLSKRNHVVLALRSLCGPGPTASSTTGINNNLQKFFHFLQSALPLALVEENHKNTGIWK